MAKYLHSNIHVAEVAKDDIVMVRSGNKLPVSEPGDIKVLSPIVP